MKRDKLPYVGSPVERFEDLRLLRGQGQFIDDLHLDGMLHAAVLRSPVAHAKITHIELDEALEIDGVVRIFTAFDFSEDIPRIPVRLFPRPELSPFEQPVIARERVRYVGEPVAVVVAKTAALAEDALELISFDFESLESVSDIGLGDLSFDAVRKPAVALFDDYPENRATTYSVTKGSIEGIFESAPYKRREKFYVHRHTGITMETRGIVAAWDAARNCMRVYGASKVPFANRKILARLMKLPETSVEMIEGDAGGSYGVRGEFFPEDFLIPFAAMHLQRPVKWIEDRREHFLSISHARDVQADLEIACERDGRILGLRGSIRVDVGAYLRTAGVISPRNAAQFLPGPYRVPNIDINVAVELSNKAPSGTYRGPGRYEADFFRERLFDLVADELQIDPVSFRRLNLVKESELPYTMPTVDPSPNPTALDSGVYEQVLDMCLEKASWDEKKSLQGKEVDGLYHGLAVGCFIEGGAAGPSENAKIELDEAGNFLIFVGSSLVGQGLQTVLSQISADALGVDIDRIRILHGSTIYVKDGWGSYHSRSTVMGGSAILLCVKDFVPLMEQVGAEMLGMDLGEVRFVGGELVALDGRSLPLSAIADRCLSVERTFFNSKHTFSYGTHVAHVGVDVGTGRVSILDYVAVEDPGVIVNPVTLHGQSVGAIVQGLGGTLMEHLVYDEAGQMLTASFVDYPMPLASDFPNIRSYSIALRPSPNNPLGIKGAGEGGIIPVGGLIANAVANALRSFKVQPKCLPLSPPIVWRLVQQASA
jgi:aerobic carbon-monoxide dehydrogenase large subunit